MVQPIRFLLDENVSNSVIDVFTARGHDVYLSRELTEEGTPDTVLAILSKYESLIIVSHDRHFRAYTKLLSEHERRRFAEGAGRLQLEVPGAQARPRIQQEMALIEFHYEDCLRRRRPFLMTIRRNNVRLDTH